MNQKREKKKELGSSLTASKNMENMRRKARNGTRKD